MGRPKGSKNKTHIEKWRGTCEVCGTEFERYYSQVSRDGWGRFCSVSCQRKGTAEQRKRFGPDHAKWNGGSGTYRERALRERGRRCEQCGYDKYERLLWVHHLNLKSRSEQDDHSIENLRVLCIRCHLEKHIEGDRSFLLDRNASNDTFINSSPL